MSPRPGRRSAPASLPTASPAWQLTLRQVDRLVSLDGPVLLRGARGVGKLHLARRLHEARDTGGPFHVLDCRAHLHRHPAWLAELARAMSTPGATLALRHVEALPAPLAAAVSGLAGPTGPALPPARLVMTAVDGGPHPVPQPLADLAEVTVTVPTLRERLAELPFLVDELLAELTRGDRRPPRCPGPVLTALRRQPWPDNVRELRHVLAAALVAGMHFDLTVDDLPVEYRHAPTRRTLPLLESRERDAIVGALQKTGWNKDEAAVELGISRATIYRKMKRFGIRTPALGG
jgi:transcriptional regulator of acetoin/glycerol metabolism